METAVPRAEALLVVLRDEAVKLGNRTPGNVPRDTRAALGEVRDSLSLAHQLLCTAELPGELSMALDTLDTATAALQTQHTMWWWYGRPRPHLELLSGLNIYLEAATRRLAQQQVDMRLTLDRLGPPRRQPLQAGRALPQATAVEEESPVLARVRSELQELSQSLVLGGGASAEVANEPPPEEPEETPARMPGLDAVLAAIEAPQDDEDPDFRPGYFPPAPPHELQELAAAPSRAEDIN